MNLIARMKDVDTEYRYYENDYDEIRRTGGGESVCYPDWSGDILSEDLPNMEITFMRKHVCDFYLNPENCEDWFDDYQAIAEKVREYRLKKYGE